MIYHFQNISKYCRLSTSVRLVSRKMLPWRFGWFLNLLTSRRDYEKIVKLYQISWLDLIAVGLFCSLPTIIHSFSFFFFKVYFITYVSHYRSKIAVAWVDGPGEEIRQKNKAFAPLWFMGKVYWKEVRISSYEKSMALCCRQADKLT